MGDDAYDAHDDHDYFYSREKLVELLRGKNILIADIQSALTTTQEQLNDEIKAHEQIANTCQKAGGRDIDGTSTGYVESLVELLTTVQEENKQYKNALETIRKYSVKHAIWEIVTMCESALNGGKNE